MVYQKMSVLSILLIVRTVKYLTVRFVLNKKAWALFGGYKVFVLPGIEK